MWETTMQHYYTPTTMARRKPCWWGTELACISGECKLGHPPWKTGSLCHSWAFTYTVTPDKWRGLLCLWIGKVNIINYVNYPQIDIQVPHNSYQNSRKTFGDIDKIILKSIWQGKETRRGNHDLRIYITTVSKTVVLVGG